MPPFRIGFLGFGEVAAVFSACLREHGGDVCAYDRNLDREGGAEVLRKRTRAEGIRFLPLPDMIGGSDYVVSTVKPQTAMEAARNCVPFLDRGKVFLDLNSVAPDEKKAIGRIIFDSGATFVEGVILGAVGATGASTSVLTGGDQGADVARTLTRLGLRARPYSAEIGKASLFKLLRSVFSKGVEALLLELFIAGRRAGMSDDLWQDVVVDLMTRTPFERTASNWIRTHPTACSRRHHELIQVSRALRELGLDPVMTDATTSFFERSNAAGLEQKLHEAPTGHEAVVELLDVHLKASRSS